MPDLGVSACQCWDYECVSPDPAESLICLAVRNNEMGQCYPGLDYIERKELGLFKDDCSSQDCGLMAEHLPKLPEA